MKTTKSKTDNIHDEILELPATPSPEQILSEIGVGSNSEASAIVEKPKRKYSPRRKKEPVMESVDDEKIHKLLCRCWGGFFAVGTAFLAKWFGREWLADKNDVDDVGEALQTYFEMKIPDFASKPEFLLVGAFSTYMLKRIDILLPISQLEYDDIGTDRDQAKVDYEKVDYEKI